MDTKHTKDGENLLDLKKELRNIKTFEELEAFLAKLEQMGNGYILISKRAGRKAYGFQKDTNAEGKMTYLFEGSNTRQNTLVNEIYKELTFRKRNN